ncbi:MAG TPA: AsmA family protein [Xanthomonadaceae bacterium]|nr:AsmA family protein [Xanthomonadaceae bacterium]
MNDAPQTHASSAPRSRLPGRRGQRWLAALALLAALLMLLFALWDWNWFKGPVESAVQARTGRELHIGNLDVDLGRVTTVRGDDLTFANADWSKQKQMASVGRAEIDIALWPLFKGQVRIPEIRLDRPDLLLETGGKDRPGNWVFGESSGDGTLPTLGRLQIHQGRMRFVDAAGRTDVDVSVDSLPSAAADAAAPIAIAGKGRWQANPFTLEGSTASPLELSQTEHPFRIDLKGSAGATHAHLRGTLTNPFQFRVFDLQMTLSGQDMEDLYPLIGIAMPSTPPYHLDGLLRRNGEVWRYDGFKGRAGDSDLAGNVRIDVGGERPYLKADLVSQRLDFDDLAGFIGAPPKTDAGETANAQQKAEAARIAAAGKVLPDKPYDLSKLRSMDADVKWKAHRINAPSLPLDDMDAHLTLVGGLLQLQPLNFGVAGGNIRSTVRMDARRDVIGTQLQASIRKLQLGKLFPDAELAKQASGSVGGEIDVTGRGNSVAAMLGSADGNIAVGMGRGHIGNLIMELAGLDIAESIKYLITKDRQIPLRCAFGDFGVRDGLMTSRALAFDTTDTIVLGEGSINLKDESLDLLLRPRPKDRSILTFRSPLRIGGTFKDPSFRPDLKALGMRGAIALALGSIAPPAALLATIETGPGEDSNCGGKYAK